MESGGKQTIKDFTDLRTWKEGHKLVLAIYKICKNFPKEERYSLCDQMQRAAISVTSNISEGFSRQSIKEKRQFYFISLGSLTELQNQLIICKDLNYLRQDTFEKIYKQSVITAKSIRALITGLKKLKSPNSRFQIPNSVISLFTAISLTLITGVSNPAFASDKTSLGFDPIKIEMDLVAGETKTKDIKIYNLNNEEQEYIVYYEKFEIAGEDGNLKFIKKKEKELDISFSETNINIPANSSKILIVNFYGKKNLPQKEYYYVIFIEPLPTAMTTVGSGSFVTGKIGILSYINFVHSEEILGELVRSGQIVEFSVKNEWNFQSPVEFTARINNTGTIHYNAYGTIKVKDNKGEVIETIVIDKATILPGTIRILKSQENYPVFNFRYLFGEFKAELDVKSEDGTVNLYEEITFQLFPIWVVISIILICISSLLTVYIAQRYKLKPNKT